MDNKRLIGTYDQLAARINQAPRKFSFDKIQNYKEWKTKFGLKVTELLGPLPEKVPLNLEILEEEVIDDWEEEGFSPFIQRKIVFDSEEFGSVVAYIHVPQGSSIENPRPAILSAHGHGSGKNLMIGMDPTAWTPVKGLDGRNFEATTIHLVKLGYIVITPDWRPFGERQLNKEFARVGRDPCNVAAMGFGYFGFNLLGLNVWDAMRCIDVLETIPEVDPTRIGMMGKSYGGTLTTYTTIMDPRIKAAVVSGYLSTLEDAFSMRGLGNFCGSQYLPGLLQWGDIPDVLGLIAPRPLLIETGTEDTCFVIQDTTKAYEKLQKIYQAAGFIDILDRDIAPVGHNVIFQKAPKFFQKFL